MFGDSAGELSEPRTLRESSFRYTRLRLNTRLMPEFPLRGSRSASCRDLFNDNVGIGRFAAWNRSDTSSEPPLAGVGSAVTPDDFFIVLTSSPASSNVLSAAMSLSAWLCDCRGAGA